jgi:hypothetical protein
MNRYYYDLHIHSCLSPCAEDDATPANIAGMAALNGLQIVALTDHNTTRNCPAFFQAARSYGLIPIAGMELTTSEDVHIICLFPTLDDASSFQRIVDERRIRIKNKPAIFGHQYVMDEDDTILDEEADLLINATTISIDEAYSLAESFGGIAYPAHIDRTSNGMVSVLGGFPTDPPFTAFELHDAESLTVYRSQYPHIGEMTYVVSSDAHELGAISEAENSFLLDDEPYSSKLVTESLFAHLRRADV